MSGILEQIVVSGGTVAVALITGYFGLKTKLASITDVTKQAAADSAEVKAQIKNTHPKNFREETDERHEELLSAIGSVQADVQGLFAAQKDIRRNVGLIRRDERQLREEFTDHLEDSSNQIADIRRLIESNLGKDSK